MSKNMFDHLVARGRISQSLAEQRLAKEGSDNTVAQDDGKSRGVLAGRLGRHATLIGALIKLVGLWSRGRRNARAIRVIRQDVSIEGLPAALEGYTVMHLSDLHLDIAADIPQVIAAVVESVDCDICVITGDFRASTRGPHKPAMEAFAQLRPSLRAPVYAVLGNHDSLAMVEEFEQMQVQVLLNEHRLISKGDAVLAMVGVDDPHYFATDDLPGAMLGVPDNAITILLSHSPELYRQAQQQGIHLMLSGHTHGGQICLPGDTR